MQYVKLAQMQILSLTPIIVNKIKKDAPMTTSGLTINTLFKDKYRIS